MRNPGEDGAGANFDEQPESKSLPVLIGGRVIDESDIRISDGTACDVDVEVVFIVAASTAAAADAGFSDSQTPAVNQCECSDPMTRMFCSKSNTSRQKIIVAIQS
jgi:hypothetical protein